MSELFSGEWMKRFMDEWNAEPDLSDALAQIGFNSVISYGLLSEEDPRGYIDVRDGKVVSAGEPEGKELSWDVRASEETWKTWMEKPPGMMKLGMAFTSGKMQFKVGDYTAMVKDPRMAGPFIKSFTVMGRV